MDEESVSLGFVVRRCSGSIVCVSNYERQTLNPSNKGDLIADGLMRFG